MDKILISHGRVIDPVRQLDKIADIYIADGRIVAAVDDFKPDVVLNASGCIVVPGLIDYHAHVFYKGTDAGVPVDMIALPNGVTTVVDGGSAGTANYESFYASIVMNSVARVKAFLALSSDGQISMHRPDYYASATCDMSRMEKLFRDYASNLVGIKLKQTRANVSGEGFDAIQCAIRLAEKIGCRINVHVIDPSGPCSQLAAYFREGDIFTHVYHGSGSTILDENRHVLPEIWEAKKRGVIFDACNGKNNFDFEVAEAAIRQNFYPDIISSDITVMTMYKQPAVSLPWLMSKYLAMGMPLQEVIKAVTATPAKHMDMEHEIGTLAPGACGDVAVFKEKDLKCEFLDIRGNCRIGNKLLLPQATIRNGMLVFRQMDFIKI
jgi:dihydroorotase